MFVNRMKLVNWRNHAETILQFAKVTGIRGDIHSGKSSIGYALEFAFTGRCKGTDAAGKGMAGLVRDGADAAGILLDVRSNRNVEMSCKLTRKPERNLTISDPSDPSYRDEPVKAWIEAHKNVLSCLLNSRHFISLDQKAQKAILSSFILPESYEWPEDIRKKCDAVNIASLIPWDGAPFEVIDAAYKAAFEKRTELNRDLKNLLIPEPITPPSGAANLSDAHGNLNELRNQLDRIQSEHRQAASSHAKATSDLHALEVRVESYEAKIRLERQALEQIDVLTAKQVKEFEKVAKGARALEETERALNQVRLDIAGVDALLAMFNALDGKNECPTCVRPVTDEFLTSAMEPHLDKRNGLVERERNLLKEQAALGDVAGAQRKLDESKDNETRKKRSEAIIAETDAMLRTSAKELDALRDKMPKAPQDVAPEVPGLRQQIEVIEKSLSEIAVADARAKEIIAARERQKKLIDAVTVLESLLTYFGKDGVKADLLKQHIGGFTEAVNAALAPWGYACSFEIEPYGFKVTNVVTGVTKDLEFLSGSEALQFCYAFQVALAQESGIRLVVIDESDVLASARGDLFEMLLRADIDQAIVIGTDTREEAPNVEGTIFYAMQDGKAVRLQPVGA